MKSGIGFVACAYLMLVAGPSARADTLDEIKRRGSIRWGGEFRLMRENNVNYGNGAPNIDVTAAWTKGPLPHQEAAIAGISRNSRPRIHR